MILRRPVRHVNQTKPFKLPIPHNVLIVPHLRLVHPRMRQLVQIALPQKSKHIVSTLC